VAEITLRLNGANPVVAQTRLGSLPVPLRTVCSRFGAVLTSMLPKDLSPAIKRTYPDRYLFTGQVPDEQLTHFSEAAKETKTVAEITEGNHEGFLAVR
jgi:hypothetical protein